MADEETKDNLYTLPQSYVEELLADIERHIDIVLCLIDDALSGDEEMKCYISLLVEYANHNFNMRKVLYKEIRDPHMFFNEQTGKEEYVITQTSLLTLQALVLGKHASRSELNSFGFSLLLN